MQLQQLRDQELLAQTKNLVKNEREVLVKILHHLREIDRRKLYCDLGFSSLFDYAVKELQYSEGQACRRIQAMRLIKEIPQVEKSIVTGELSLSNVSQAQTLFRTIAKESTEGPMPKQEKIEVLNSLKNKSAREGQKELLKIQPQMMLPKEKERTLTETSTEVRFVMTEKLKAKLENVRSLLGTKGANMTYGELFDEMAELSVSALEAKKFGKKNVQSNPPSTSAVKNVAVPKPSKNLRYISKPLFRQVWQMDKGRCRNCKSQRHLNIDHILPIARGGKSELRNLRLLCFHCNQRVGIRAFGLGHMELKMQKR